MQDVSFNLTARPAIESLRASRIRDIVNAGLGRTDLVTFWLGEPDEVTPDFIRNAGIASLQRGETFYTHNLGIPELREALAAYVTRLHRPTGTENVAVTSSGMEALILATQALVEAGDRTVVVTPVWPNVLEIPKIMGASVATVPLTYSMARWSLDVDRLLEAVTAATRILYLNSPNNPTGWTLEKEPRDAILEHCRRLGVWIIEDDAYERLYYRDASPAAPSFLDAATPEDRVIGANTFSKAWLMTGWGLGWVIPPPAAIPSLGKLIEYNTSCAPVFVQRAGVTAITEGEPAVAHTVRRFRRARDLLVAHLNRIPGIEVSVPEGAMYVFFRVAGMEDTVAFCQQLIATVGLGLAPGSAFGPEGEGFVRWCFAASEAKLAEGVERLKRAVQGGNGR